MAILKQLPFFQQLSTVPFLFLKYHLFPHTCTSQAFPCQQLLSLLQSTHIFTQLVLMHQLDLRRWLPRVLQVLLPQPQYQIYHKQALFQFPLCTPHGVFGIIQCSTYYNFIIFIFWFSQLKILNGSTVAVIVLLLTHNLFQFTYPYDGGRQYIIICQQLIDNKTMSSAPANSLEKRNLHYNMFEFDEKMTSCFNYNINRNYGHNFQPSQSMQIPFQINENEVPQYEIVLIEDQLNIQVFDSGFGNYAKRGQHIKYRCRIYDAADNAKDIQKRTTTCIYGNNQNSLPLELIFAISKLRFKVRAFLGTQLSMKITKQQDKQRRIVIQLQVIAISDNSFTDCFIDLTQYHNQIVQLAIKADEAFQARNLQESLKKYEKAVQKICSYYYTTSIELHTKKPSRQKKQQLKRTVQKNKKYNLQQQIKLIEQKMEIALQMEQLANKIMIKAIQVAQISNQHFKVIKWSRIIMNNMKDNKTAKILILRALSFIEQGEFDKAKIDLENATKMCTDSNNFVAKQIQYAKQKIQSMLNSGAQHKQN